MRKPAHYCREIRPPPYSPRIGLAAVEPPVRRKLFAKSTDARQRAFAALVARDVKSPFAGDMHLDLVSLFERQRLDNGSRQTRSVRHLGAINRRLRWLIARGERDLPLPNPLNSVI